MARKQITVKVTRNLYGNYRGFVTGQQSKELGCNEFDAIHWAGEMLEANPAAVLSEKSDFGMAAIETQRETTARVCRK